MRNHRTVFCNCCTNWHCYTWLHFLADFVTFGFIIIAILISFRWYLCFYLHFLKYYIMSTFHVPVDCMSLKLANPGPPQFSIDYLLSFLPSFFLFYFLIFFLPSLSFIFWSIVSNVSYLRAALLYLPHTKFYTLEFSLKHTFFTTNCRRKYDH